MTAVQRLSTPFQVTQRVDVALHAVVFLSLSGQDFVTTEQIAEHNAIGVKALSDVLRSLRSAGVVESRPGWHGGFRLCQSPDQITLDRVVAAVQGAAADASNRESEVEVSRSGAAHMVASFWQTLDRQILASLMSLTVADLAAYSDAG
jgi:Rrf2 family protein